MEQTTDIRDYIAILKRRRFPVAVTVATIFCLSVAVALLLPSVYRSTATILIESQDIPPELVRSTVTSYAAERIQVIDQRVRSRTNLLGLMDKFSLYAELRDSKTIEELVEDMREDINLEIISADVIDPRSGRPTEATIAFTLSFEGKVPSIVQKVANELASLYLKENLRSRTQKATEASSFLREEAQRLSIIISELEENLAEFKEKNVNRLPELKTLNMQLMDRTEKEISDLSAQIRSLEERKFYLDGQLAQIKPEGDLYGEDGQRILSSHDRLKSRQSEYVTARARYSEVHPDVVKLKREIEALQKEVGSTGQSKELAVQLTQARSELSQALEKYTETHPDVVKLSRQVAALEKALSELPKQGVETTVYQRQPENPAYITLQAQMNGIEADLKSLQASRSDRVRKLSEYEQRLMQTPQVERQYLSLTRDYDNAVRRYQELKAKQMEAEVALQLETESKGERFSLIESPQLPEEPVKPNRLAIIFLGFIFSLGGGFGYAAVAEAMDHSIRGMRGIIAVTGAPPLAVIPYIALEEEIQPVSTKTKAIGGIAVVGGAVLLLISVHFAYKPLDVLWFVILRKFGL